MQADDTSWLNSSLPSGVYTHSLYVADNADAEFHPPVNKGHEGMMYLTFIIDHYDKLSSIGDIFIFLHAHPDSWHNNPLHDGKISKMLTDLSLPRVQREGYFNLRCEWDPGCPNYLHPFETPRDEMLDETRLMRTAFMELFPGEPVPIVLSVPCCAQFALTAAAILRNPLERYVRIRKWLMEVNEPDAASGRVLEYLWHWLFTGKEEVCEPVHVCYCDGYGICFGGDWEVAKYSKMEESDAKKEWLRVARERGQKPERRALEAGREWKKGDGF